MVEHGKDFQGYSDRFDPKSYLEYYCGTLDKKQGILKFIHDTFKRINENQELCRNMLDYGAGCSFHVVIGAAGVVSEICMAEYTEKNRAVLNDWLKGEPDAFDWSPFLKQVVEDFEGNRKEDAIEDRERRLKAITKAVVSCDLRSEKIIQNGYEGPYDIVTCVGVVETCARNEEEFDVFVHKLSFLVREGGKIILGCWKHPPGVDGYKVGNEFFNDLPVEEDFVVACLKKAGFSRIETTAVYSNELKYPVEVHFSEIEKFACIFYVGSKAVITH